MILCQNKDGTWGKYEEPYTTVDFKTEEDFKKFEEILNYYNNRTEHDSEVRNEAIDDFVKGMKKYMETTEQASYIDEINKGNDNYSAMTIYDYIDELAEQLKGE